MHTSYISEKKKGGIFYKSLDTSRLSSISYIF
jgi:hypothetical protein